MSKVTELDRYDISFSYGHSMTKQKYGEYCDYSEAKEIIESLEAERDSLKEQLWKAQHENEVFMHGLVEMEKLVSDAAYCIDQEKQKTLKAEAAKAEAVRIAIKLIKRECRGCEFAYQCEDMRKSNCFSTEVNTLESLTGQKFEEMRG